MFKKFPQVQAPLPSAFDPQGFAAGSFEGSNDTRFLLIEAKEYNAIIKGPWNDDRGTRIRTTEKGQVILDVVYTVDDEPQRQKLNVNALPSVRQSIFLDLTEQGGLDMGPFKNGALGRLREALGLNAAGQKWSFADFIGRPVRIKVGHRADKNDPSKVYTDVESVTKL